MPATAPHRRGSNLPGSSLLNGPQICLSPQGRLYISGVSDGAAVATTSKVSWPPKLLLALAREFEIASGRGLLTLAQTELSPDWPAGFAWWKEFCRRLGESLCCLDEADRERFGKRLSREKLLQLVPPPDALELSVIISKAPPMHGLEYLASEVLTSLWLDLLNSVHQHILEAQKGLDDCLHILNPDWQPLGRVTFHLAENKKDEAKPFAFLATYTNRVSGKATVKHLPLAEALQQFASEKQQSKLAELLKPVSQASQSSELIRSWLDSRALFRPQALSISQAHQFLSDVPAMERAGLIVRVPNWWRARSSTRAEVRIRLGNDKPRGVGTDSLLDFSVELALDGDRLTEEEQQQLLAQDEGLMLLRGKWIEVDRERLTEALQHWQQLEQENTGGIDFLRGMRMLAGATLASDDVDSGNGWTQVVAGGWMEKTLQSLRNPTDEISCQPGTGLNATLRPYQETGVRWLWLMTQLKLGACLADDMGLGKTIQVIDLLLQIDRVATAANKRHVLNKDGSKRKVKRRPSLLIVPASLIGNWKQELARFAPQLKVAIAHRSESAAKDLEAMAADPIEKLKDVNAVVTSYSLARKSEWMAELDWDLVILDEAQAIKNSTSAQSRAIKKLRSSCRIALTGTPVENQLGDLWSLFDFCCPGLLGTSKEFKQFLKHFDTKATEPSGSNGPNAPYAALRRLVQPYILRRMKTDPTIAPDLPAKTEMRVDCGLSRRQAALYKQAVKELESELQSQLKQNKISSEKKSGIQRRGIVLSTMMRLKQVCNHPSLVMDNNEFASKDSGKFQQLIRICEPITQRQEKVLVFTQFQSMCEPLADFLATVFGNSGLTLHGKTPVKRRKQLVKSFQEDESIPFFVISLKAGGTGLNLTAASHVIHFDRWWNPAVENQATDRAFRIGQKRNVLVHKFVCRGTLEERIDEMLRSKQEMTDEILGQKNEGELLLTELSDKELLEFVTLDIHRCET
jgi:non-specific serine/threonine protein kinase